MESDNEDNMSISSQPYGLLCAELIDIIKDYPILMEKSQLPYVKHQKAAALEQAKLVIAKNTGRKLDDKQVMKKIANMKAIVKKKIATNRTSNYSITLCAWEEQLYKIMYGEDAPAVTKVSPAIFSGYRKANASATSRRLNRPSAPAQPVYHGHKEGNAWSRPSSSNSPNMRAPLSHSMPPFRRPKRRILSAETVETVGLSMTELQRLVLLEKLRYTRMKMRCLEQSQQAIETPYPPQDDLQELQP